MIEFTNRRRGQIVKSSVVVILLIWFLLMASAAQCADQESKDVRWQKLWDRADRMTDAPEFHPYNRQWLGVQNTYWSAIAKKCMPQLKAEHVPKFRTVLVIDEAGRITDFFSSQDSEAVRCFKNELLGKEYPKPPESPFYMALEIRSQ